MRDEWGADAFQPYSPFVLLVLGPDALPETLTEAAATANPELSLLCALMHNANLELVILAAGHPWSRRGVCKKGREESLFIVLDARGLTERIALARTSSSSDGCAVRQRQSVGELFED